MKSLIFTFTIFIIISFRNDVKAQFQIDAFPATKFIEIIDYLNKNYSESLFYEYNRLDKLLNTHIDSLLNTEVYGSLCKKMSVELNHKEYFEKEAYKVGFYCYPENLIEMAGGVNELWHEWQLEGNFEKSSRLITEIENSKDSIQKIVFMECLELLPINEIENNTSVFLCFDGNRGSYKTGQIIIMDLLDYKMNSLNTFIHTLEHELHHIEYENWVQKKYGNSIKSDRQKAIFRFQLRIILEGTALQYTFQDKNTQSKNLFTNQELLSELSEEWFNGLRKLKQIHNPLKFYSKYKSEMWRKSEERLKRFCEGKVENATYSNRPTTDYFISFNLYNSIRVYGGKDLFEEVISKPELLLTKYNDIWNSNCLIPKIPNDIIDIWVTNLKTTPNNVYSK